MIVDFHSFRRAAPDRGAVQRRHGAHWRSKPELIGKKVMLKSLRMFFDLGLTPDEMSRLSGLPPGVIEEELKQFNAGGSQAAASGSARCRVTKVVAPKRGADRPMKKALLLEDDILVAMDLAYEMESRGVAIVQITSSLEEALKLIEEDGLDLAIMNIELQDGLSYPAARRLRALGIPFAFFTSFARYEIDARFWDVPYLSKPQAPELVAKFVADFINTPGTGDHTRPQAAKR